MSTAYEFTLDFGVATEPPLQNAPVAPGTIVARVRLPVTLLFDVLRALNDTMTVYESEWGEIRRPRRERNA